MAINQLQPQKNFAIARQLPDPSDSTTYYIRATIRYAETDTLIATVNLEDKGSRRFVGIWRAIADKSGQGTLITVTTTVYTDSGYSTQSTIYTEQIETYLIMQMFNPREIVAALGPALGAMGGGPDIDYKRIKKIFKEVLEDQLKPAMSLLEAIEAKKIDIPQGLTENDIEGLRVSLESSLTEATESIKDSIPPAPVIPDPVDLSPIMEELRNVAVRLNSAFFRAFREYMPLIGGDIKEVSRKLSNMKQKEGSPVQKTGADRAAEILGKNTEEIEEPEEETEVEEKKEEESYGTTRAREILGSKK